MSENFDNREEWVTFFKNVRHRPDAFYTKIMERLIELDFFAPTDLAWLDDENVDTKFSVGEVSFLQRCIAAAKANEANGTVVSSGESQDVVSLRAELANEKQKVRKLEEEVKEAEKKENSLKETVKEMEKKRVFASGGDEALTDDGGVISVIAPGTEDIKGFMERGGCELSWSSMEGAKVKKFKEKPFPKVVDHRLALPELYLHFLDNMFLPPDTDCLDSQLRSSNDNSEIVIFLPDRFTNAEKIRDLIRALDNDLAQHLRNVLDFIILHGEPQVSQLKQNGVRNLESTCNKDNLFYCLRAARPKAPVNLDRRSFGIPQEADVYLFAQNHACVEFASESVRESFMACMEGLPETDREDLKKLTIFLKIFYEGGFAYNKNVQMQGGFFPRTIGIAGLGTSPFFEDQMGIGTGYPYLVPAKHLHFADSVPVTIPAISEMSKRHGRYGLCFTRLCQVWKEESFSRDGNLNYACFAPFGGFFYVPANMSDFQKLGGFVYEVGGARQELETPMDTLEGSSVTHSNSRRSERDYRVCVNCLSEEASMVTIPCGHRAFCPACTRNTSGDDMICPVCEQTVSNFRPENL